MKILMLNPFLWPHHGGTEKHVWEVSKRLAKSHDVTILTAKLEGTKRREEKEGVNIIRTPCWVLKDLPKPLPPPIPLMLRQSEDLKGAAKKADLLHGHNRFFYGLEPAGVAKKYEKKLCWTLHNARPKGIDLATDFWGQAFDDTMGKALLNQCDGVLGVSRNTLDITLPDNFKGVKSVAYNGVDHSLFRPHKSGVKEALEFDKMVLCVARMVKQKGLDYLIDAMAGVDATLVLVGRGPEEKDLKRRAKKKGAKVFFVTRELGDNTLSDYYAACDVFALPSLWEPFGMVLTEAMASGKPVVGTKVGGIPEVVSEGKDGFLAEPKNPEALRRKICFLLDNPKKAKRMGEAGRRKALKQFTWDNTAKAYMKLYERIEE
ncbi:glycosyltransferase family 4 protein [Candidatus Micrarchaeota archaeon]|nr:glycosyltransferase family 4 protein [Candidatus Micrarchaeota archaeon]